MPYSKRRREEEIKLMLFIYAKHTQCAVPSFHIHTQCIFLECLWSVNCMPLLHKFNVIHISFNLFFKYYFYCCAYTPEESIKKFIMMLFMYLCRLSFFRRSFDFAIYSRESLFSRCCAMCTFFVVWRGMRRCKGWHFCVSIIKILLST